ncbi:MAG: hypothetical protein ACLQRH_05600 [Acidimicrobiales bacterium]
MFEGIVDNDEAFGAVRVDEEGGTICWPNGADLGVTVSPLNGQ